MKKWLKNKRLWTGLLCLLALVGLLGVVARFFTDKVAPGTGAEIRPAVRIGPWLTVEYKVAADLETALGTVQSRENVLLSSRILSRVTKILVVSGDNVKKNDTVMELDQRELNTRIEQAKEHLNQVRAERADAESNFKRARDLFDNKVLSKADYDSAASLFDSRTAQLNRAGQVLAEAEVYLSYASIRAPISGRVVDKFVEAGDTVSPGQALLEIYNPETLRLEAVVRESLIQKLSIGQTLQVRLETLSKSVEGKVAEILPAINPGSRSLRVRIALPETPGLLTGMFGRLEIPKGNIKRVMIPDTAVEIVGQLQFVWAQGVDGKPVRRYVRLGPRRDGWYEVLSGLKAQEKIAVLQ
ncbi:efflux RND transporter periplasmic adaptor subunit [Planctomycetota bacterium]